ncbi:hypothetical protein ACLOJK_036716 [Asimina triloba]
MGGADASERRQWVEADGGVGPSSPAAAWWTALETDAFEENGRSEMGHDRSGIELNLLMTGEEDSPRVASVINVDLRPRQIWNVLIVFFVMNGSDGPSGRSPVVSINEDDDDVVPFFVDSDGHGGGGRHRRRHRALARALATASPANNGSGGDSHGCRPSHVADGEGGAP